jgi:hypothetical protein
MSDAIGGASVSCLQSIVHPQVASRKAEHHFAYSPMLGPVAGEPGES